MISNFFNFHTASNDKNQSVTKRTPSLQLPNLSPMASFPTLPTSLSLESIKSQTAKVSSNVLSSLKVGSTKVTQYIKNPSPHSDQRVSPSDIRFPSIFDQLKWPNLSLDPQRSSHRKYSGVPSHIQEEEEESVLDKFVRVIQTEDREEWPENTFFNHPNRV